MLGLLEIGEEPRTALVIRAADFRETDLARGAVQQTRPEPVLECFDMLADHASGEVQARRGSGEASALGHLGEDPHALEAIHGTL